MEEKERELTEVGRGLVTGDNPVFEIVWNPMGSNNPMFKGPWLRRRDTQRLVRKLDSDEYIVRS